MDLPVLIPAYNPGNSLLSVTGNLIELGFQKIVIVNDGSKPECNHIFQRLKEMPACHVLHHAVNLGKGAALKTGFNYVLITWPAVKTVITADADGQHAPEDILRIAQTSMTTPDAFVLGTREFHKDIPLRSFIGNSITRIVFRIFTGLNVTDTQTGLRAWPRPFCMQALKIDLNGYDFEMESLVQAKHKTGHGFRIAEVPIQTIYEEGNKSSHFNPLLDSMRIYFVFIRYAGAAMTNALVDNLVFLLAFYQTQSIGLSQLLGRSAATAIAFLLAKNVVFNSSERWLGSLIKFVLLVIATGGVSYGAINFLHANFGFDIIPAKLLTEGLLFLGNFAIQRDLIFSARREK